MSNWYRATSALNRLREAGRTGMFKKMLTRLRTPLAKPCEWCGEKSVGLRTLRERTSSGWIAVKKIRACERHLSGPDDLPPAERIKLKGRGSWASWWR